MKERRRTPRRPASYWRKVVPEISGSEHIKRACSERGVSLDCYYYWRRKLRKEEKPSSSVDFFHEVGTVSLFTEEVEVHFGGSARVVVRGGLTTERLTTILSSVKEVG